MNWIELNGYYFHFNVEHSSIAISYDIRSTTLPFDQISASVYQNDGFRFYSTLVCLQRFRSTGGVQGQENDKLMRSTHITARETFSLDKRS